MVNPKKKRFAAARAAFDEMIRVGAVATEPSRYPWIRPRALYACLGNGPYASSNANSALKQLAAMGLAVKRDKQWQLIAGADFDGAVTQANKTLETQA